MWDIWGGPDVSGHNGGGRWVYGRRVKREKEAGIPQVAVRTWKNRKKVS